MSKSEAIQITRTTCSKKVKQRELSGKDKGMQCTNTRIKLLIEGKYFHGKTWEMPNKKKNQPVWKWIVVRHTTGWMPHSVQAASRSQYRLDVAFTTGWMPPSLQVGCRPHYRLDATLTIGWMPPSLWARCRSHYRITLCPCVWFASRQVWRTLDYLCYTSYRALQLQPVWMLLEENCMCCSFLLLPGRYSARVPYVLKYTVRSGPRTYCIRNCKVGLLSLRPQRRQVCVKI